MLTVEEIREFHRKVEEGEIKCPGTRVEQVYHYAVGRLLELLEGVALPAVVQGEDSDDE